MRESVKIRTDTFLTAGKGKSFSAGFLCTVQGAKSKKEKAAITHALGGSGIPWNTIDVSKHLRIKTPPPGVNYFTVVNFLFSFLQIICITFLPDIATAGSPPPGSTQ